MHCYRSRRLGADEDSEARALYRLVIRQAAIIRGQGLRLVRLAREIAVLEGLTRGRLMQVTRTCGQGIICNVIISGLKCGENRNAVFVKWKLMQRKSFFTFEIPHVKCKLEGL